MAILQSISGCQLATRGRSIRVTYISDYITLSSASYPYTNQLASSRCLPRPLANMVGTTKIWEASRGISGSLSTPRSFLCTVNLPVMYQPKAVYAKGHILKSVPYSNNRECTFTLGNSPAKLHSAVLKRSGRFRSVPIKRLQGCNRRKKSAENGRYLSDSDSRMTRTRRFLRGSLK